MLKRSNSESVGANDQSTALIVKKAKENDDNSNTVISSGALTLTGSGDGDTKNSAVSLIPQSFQKPGRRSGLQSHNMLLSGHEGVIYSLCFDGTGQNICSAGMDSKIFLWEVYGDCKNYNVLAGHKNAVLEVKWIPSTAHIVSASADKTAALWDANKGVKIRKYGDHTSIVNSCAISRDFPTRFATGSDDCTAVVWDIRNKYSVQSFYHDYQVTSTALSHDGQYLYTGGIDNIIRRWDTRGTSGEPDLVLNGHSDSVTGLSISPDGSFLLSNSMDASLRSWDVRPFVVDEANRCHNVFIGATHGAEKNLLRCAWSPDQNFVTCGSANRNMQIWDALTTKLLYCLGGHKGSVNDSIFHPIEPIVATCSTDKQILLGELGEVSL